MWTCLLPLANVRDASNGIHFLGVIPESGVLRPERVRKAGRPGSVSLGTLVDTAQEVSEVATVWCWSARWTVAP
jgi:hypothetical protein